MFNAASYRSMYERFMGPLARPILLLPREGAGFGEYSSKAHVTAYDEKDLVSGGPVQLGDLKLIINIGDLPGNITKMDMQDRIAIDGRQYAIIHWDAYSRTLGDDSVAIEVTVRGGGLYAP